MILPTFTHTNQRSVQLSNISRVLHISSYCKSSFLDLQKLNSQCKGFCKSFLICFVEAIDHGGEVINGSAGTKECIAKVIVDAVEVRHQTVLVILGKPIER